MVFFKGENNSIIFEVDEFRFLLLFGDGEFSSLKLVFYCNFKIDAKIQKIFHITKESAEKNQMSYLLFFYSCIFVIHHPSENVWQKHKSLKHTIQPDICAYPSLASLRIA